MSTFLAMGGYAAYVWPAYVASFIVLVTAAALTIKAHARAKKVVRQLEEESGEGEGEAR